MSVRAVSNAYRTTRPWEGLDDSWMKDGACSDLSSEGRSWFFADTSRDVEAKIHVLEARRLCWRCPVSDECLEFAIEAKMHGIWGGLTEKERREIVRERKGSV